MGKNKKRYKTTDEDLQVFATAVCNFMGVFGLLDWEIIVEAEYNEGCRACVYLNPAGRLSRFCLNPSGWDDKPTHWELRRVAFHEVMEVFINDLRNLIRTDHVTEELIETTSHRMIRILENVVFQELDDGLGCACGCNVVEDEMVMEEENATDE